jgi:hypothetical protein
LHFHQLAAFYGTTGLPDNVFKGIGELPGQYKAELLGSTEPQEIQPEVPFYRELLPEEGKPRQRLAAWITHPDNRAFARATVNRVWALMYSRPLVEPVDSIPLDESVPAVMDILAEDFAASRFDLRHLIRLIVHSQSFQRDSRADFQITAQHEQMYAIFPITQLRPEQVANSIFQASKLSPIDAQSSILVRLAFYGETDEFLKNCGDRGVDEFDDQKVTIPQRLLMMNGKLVEERSKQDLVANAASRIATLVADDRVAIEMVYLCTLGRMPADEELDNFHSILAETKGNRRTRAIGDLYWALVNSTEFSWNH